ncbi:aminotransferase class V-fold PLP-dependent enzyme [Flavobacterium luteolum]|uniref:aminotransferase class V-fold PLP-dependent enzyme n=1 Tax=Flavobacterium luteolum TaxID=3003259 RepID=UPI00248EC25C|nr:aminotransferase class V-fold PLP-dependent enzyme [Flavobacterium luteolum]
MSTTTTQNNISPLESYFGSFRPHIVGTGHRFKSYYGEQKLVYADWIASGRLYGPIEDIMRYKIGPMIANTHSFSSETGKASTYAYQHARMLIKKHVNAAEDDVLVTTGAGMTAALSKLQRLMGLQQTGSEIQNSADSAQKPVVFITHMEHHSNQVPWYEIGADVVILPADENFLADPSVLDRILDKYKDRKVKIGSFTACSNVTGIITPYHKMAAVMHKHGGICIIDFAASAPYANIDMHPADPEERLDAVLFSPHKFLGGPGTCGILIFNEKLYKSRFPDNPGGGNVKCTNPWGDYFYSNIPEVREDGGTPGFLQVMRTALCIELKEKMGVENMKKREKELLHLCYTELLKIPGLSILGDIQTERIGCVSFTVENIHYNLLVRLLNDRFGIQVRGGWSCASTYAHHLFDIDKKQSQVITKGILEKDLTQKPGWVRLSLHPTMTNEELLFICDAVQKIAFYCEDWQKGYQYNPASNEFDSITEKELLAESVKEWFILD